MKLQPLKDMFILNVDSFADGEIPEGLAEAANEFKPEKAGERLNLCRICDADCYVWVEGRGKFVSPILVIKTP